MEKLVINTTRRLYKPIEIEINGKTYTVIAEFTRPFLKKLTHYDKIIDEGDLDAPYERLKELIGKHAVIDKLDIREVNKITRYVIKGVFLAADNSSEIEKNVKRPGEKK